MYIWNYNDIRIFKTIGAVVKDNTCIVSGVGFNYDRAFTWDAVALSQGWCITISSGLGLVGSMQGATFNLPLEVATAAGRLM